MSDTETRTYEVELSIEGYAFVTVEAEDEDEAHDLAVSDWREQINAGDIEVDSVHVEGKPREVAA